MLVLICFGINFLTISIEIQFGKIETKNTILCNVNKDSYNGDNLNQTMGIMLISVIQQAQFK